MYLFPSLVEFVPLAFAPSLFAPLIWLSLQPSAIASAHS
jgi:hypothetical protein